MVQLFHGKNTFLSKTRALEAVSECKDRCDKKNIPYEYRIFDASSASAETILAEIETPSLFSPHKVIYIKRLNKNSEKESLHECILSLAGKKGQNENVDIIIWEDEKLRANLRFVKGLKKADATEEIPEFKKPSFRSWAQEQAAAHDLSLSRDAMYLLSERTNYDPERLTRELAKLSLLGKNELGEEDIENLCPDTLEHTIWQLIDAINDNDPGLAERKLDLMLRQGNDPFYVLVMIARNIRIVLLTKLLLQQGANTYEIAKKVKAPPFTINAIKRNAQQTSMERLISLYDKLSNIDYSGKTGQLDTSLALNILLSVI
jgi:DNA polymerase III subunit delta